MPGYVVDAVATHWLLLSDPVPIGLIQYSMLNHEPRLVPRRLTILLVPEFLRSTVPLALRKSEAVIACALNKLHIARKETKKKIHLFFITLDL